MNQNKSTMLVFDRKLIEEKEYWLQKLSGEIQETNLKLDHPRADIYQSERASADILVSEELFEGLNRLTGDKDFLLYAALMAGLKACLHKYTGHTTLVIGSPARAESGVCNVLPIVDRLAPDSSFRQLLINVRQTLLDAYARQNYPFERLITDFSLEKMKNRFPFFDIALTLDNIHCELPLITNDITIRFKKDLGRLSGVVEFNANLIGVETIERFTRHYMNILMDGIRDVNRSIADLELMTDKEQYKILVEWNDTKRAYPQDKCFHQLFEEQVNRTPERIAAVFSSGHEDLESDLRLTYAELNRGSNQLAHYLQGYGVGPDKIVGLFMERSLSVITAILGILKAGGAYLPLDRQYPAQRLEYMIRDAGVSVLLTDSHLKQDLDVMLPREGKKTDARIILMDSDWWTISRCDEQTPASGVQPDHLAYVMYTSGSTGNPKGVLTSHRGWTNLAKAHVRIFDVRPDSRVIQLSTLNFDASVSEFAMALTSGASLYLGSTDALSPGDPLLRFLRKNAITHMTITPSNLQVLPHEDLPMLKIIIVAGDNCSSDLVRHWAGGRRFFNAYGVTEASVCALTALCDNARPSPPLGRPIDNTQVYILDRRLHPVPVGIPGELYIGGPCLARGYLNLPELTATRFINNPLKSNSFHHLYKSNGFKPANRLYKTGDKVRYLASGEIEFLGRMDHQIKMRGYRIEPGEVEKALTGRDDVAQAVVVERKDPAGESRLAAYVVMNENDEPVCENYGQEHCIRESLRDYLQGRLPRFMVPSDIVVLDKLPLSPNGKIDRKRLPTPKSALKGGRAGYVGPRDLPELQLVQMWEELLDTRHVGVKDNFFKLGGYSILAVQLMARIEQYFGRRLPISMIFEYPTIEQLAIEVRRQTGPRKWSPLVMIQKGKDRKPVFCVHPGGGTAVGYLELARLLDDGLPVYAFQAKGFEKGQTPVDQVDKMAADYVSALRAVQPEGPYYLIGWCLGARISFEMAMQLQAQGEQVPLLAFLDAYAPSVIPDDLLELDDAARMMSLVAQEVPTLSIDHLRALEPDEMMLHVLDNAKKANAAPPDFGLEEGHRFFKVFKTNSRLAHCPVSGIFNGRIVLFRAEEEIEFASRLTQREDLGWGDCTTNGANVDFVPGNHNTLVREPYVKQLAVKLNTYINQAQKEQ